MIPNVPLVPGPDAHRRLAESVNYLLNFNYAKLTNAANDAAAATAGVKVGQLYRNGSVIMVRIV